MSAFAVQAASFDKLMPSLLERPEFSLGAAKLLINRLLLNMRVPHYGMGAGIRQVSFRRTDLCNLRCYTCGRWGDNGYLVGRPIARLVRNEISPDRYIELLDDLIQHEHRPRVYLWSGEPILYRGLVPLVEALAGLGLSYLAWSRRRAIEMVGRL
jgi:hypothetical protein